MEAIDELIIEHEAVRQALEEEKIGVGKHERFHQMLSELGNIYLQ